MEIAEVHRILKSQRPEHPDLLAFYLQVIELSGDESAIESATELLIRYDFFVEIALTDGEKDDDRNYTANHIVTHRRWLSEQAS